MVALRIILFLLFISYHPVLKAQEVDCSLIPMEFSNNSFEKTFCFRSINAQSNTYEAWFDSNIAYLYLSHTNIRNPNWAFTGADFSKSLQREYIEASLDGWADFLNPGPIIFFDKDRIHRSDDKKKFYYRLFKTENLSGMRFTTNFNDKNDLNGYFFLFDGKELNSQSAVSVIDAIYLKNLRTKTTPINNVIFQNNYTIEKTDPDAKKDNSYSKKTIVDTEDIEAFKKYCETTPLGEIDEKLLQLCLNLK